MAAPTKPGHVWNHWAGSFTEIPPLSYCRHGIADDEPCDRCDDVPEIDPIYDAERVPYDTAWSMNPDRYSRAWG